MKAFLTLDYELFMGKDTGSVENCLIQPMNALISMLDQYDIKCNIFVDAAYLLRCYQLKDYNLIVNDDYNRVINHIKLLSEQGHSIQLHFHPQWLYSNHDGKVWNLDFKHYKIDDMSIEDAIKYLNESIDLLQTYSQNRICSFRAGGYSFSNNVKVLELLYKKGIYIDTSVLRGTCIASEYQSYNYVNIPKITSYRFSKDNNIEDKNGQFIEYPISTQTYIGFIYILKKLKISKCYKLHCRYDLKWGDGMGIGHPGNIMHQCWTLLSQLFKYKSINATIDGCFSQYLGNVLQYSKENLWGDDFVIIGHPKLLSQGSILYFEQFIKGHTELNFSIF